MLIFYIMVLLVTCYSRFIIALNSSLTWYEYNRWLNCLRKFYSNSFSCWPGESTNTGLQKETVSWSTLIPRIDSNLVYILTSTTSSVIFVWFLFYWTRPFFAFKNQGLVVIFVTFIFSYGCFSFFLSSIFYLVWTDVTVHR